MNNYECKGKYPMIMDEMSVLFDDSLRKKVAKLKSELSEKDDRFEFEKAVFYASLEFDELVNNLIC